MLFRNKLGDENIAQTRCRQSDPSSNHYSNSITGGMKNLVSYFIAYNHANCQSTHLSGIKSGNSLKRPIELLGGRPTAALLQAVDTYHHEVASIPLGEVNRESCSVSA